MSGPLNQEWQQLAANAICHAAQLAGDEVRYAASFYMRPSAVMRPDVFKDGKAWCALYGHDIAIGVCGFGDTPEKACAAFDAAWEGKCQQVSTDHVCGLSGFNGMIDECPACELNREGK